MRSLVARDDAGAIAILYALTLLILIGFAALVLDLGALRTDRRAAQTTADFASAAAASHLGEGIGGSPRDACRSALSYFRMNTPGISLSDGEISTFCDDNFPLADDGCWQVGQFPDEGERIRESLPVDPYLVTLTWPVDIDPEDYDDGYSAEIDGDRCERFAVQISRTRDFVFGRALDVDEQGETGAFAISRARVGTTSREVVNLMLLDRYGCNALATTGGGDVRLRALERPDPITGDLTIFIGRAYVDSDGTWSGGPGDRRCGNNKFTIDPGGNSRITAEGDIDPDHDTPPWGQIRLFAQPAGEPECVGTACDQDQIRDDDEYYEPGILPQPINLPDRIGRSPADHAFNCKGDYTGLLTPDGEPWEVEPCPGTNGNAHIDELRGDWQTAQTNRGGFEVWPADEGDCTVDDPVTLDAGDYWIDCDTLQVNDKLTILPDSNLVFRGSLRISQNDGEIDFNDGGGPAFVYFGTGSGIVQGGVPIAISQSRGRIGLDQTTIILYDSVISSTADAELDWTAPEEDGSDFENLALWSDGNSHEQRLTGQGGMILDGVFFTPNSKVSLRGGGAQEPQRAQFFAWRLDLVGSATLTMTPDPDRLLDVPAFEGVDIIR